MKNGPKIADDTNLQARESGKSRVTGSSLLPLLRKHSQGLTAACAGEAAKGEAAHALKLLPFPSGISF